MSASSPKRRKQAPRRSDFGIRVHQVLAAAFPLTPINELAALETADSGDSASSAGNFKDLEMLLEQLGSQSVFELGMPLPNQRYLIGQRYVPGLRYLPGTRAGSCPAAHNHALIDQEPAQPASVKQQP